MKNQMKKKMMMMKTVALGIPVFIFTALSHAQASEINLSRYDLTGSATYVSDFDIEADFPNSIELGRSVKTSPIHEIRFNVLNHTYLCVLFEKVCIAPGPNGSCSAYEDRCSQYEDHTMPVEKTLELDFRAAQVLGATQHETYTLTLERRRPDTDGDDQVMTTFSADQTITPVTISGEELHYRIWKK